MTSVDNSPVDFIPSIHYTIINSPTDCSTRLSTEENHWRDDLEHLVSRNYAASHKPRSNSRTNGAFTNNSSFINPSSVLCYENNRNKIDNQNGGEYDGRNLAPKTVVNVNMGYNCGSSLESVVNNQGIKDKNNTNILNFSKEKITNETNQINDVDKISTMNSNSPVNTNSDTNNQKRSFKSNAKSGHSRQWGSCGSAVTLRLMNFESTNFDTNTDLSMFTDNPDVATTTSKITKENNHSTTNYHPMFALPNDPVTPTDEKNNRSYFKNYPHNFKRISQASFEAEFDADGRIHDQMNLDLRKIDPLIIAGQITLIEHALFAGLKSEEFLSFKWTGPSKHLYAPGIVACTKWFNQLHFWAQKMILETKDLHKRAEMLGYFIRIIKKLVDNFNNLSSGMALVRALDCQCIHRLKQTWACLSSREKTIHKKMEELFSDDNNYENLRQVTDTLKLPCVPYIGLCLFDLTYIKARSKLTEFESQSDADRISNILNLVSACQESTYEDIVPNMMIIRYLESQRYIEELQNVIEDYNHRLSNALEPPEKQKSSPNMLAIQSSPGSVMSPQQQHPASSSSQQKALVPYPISSGNALLNGATNSVNNGAGSGSNLPQDISNQNQAGHPLDPCPAYCCAGEQQAVSSGPAVSANMTQPVLSNCHHHQSQTVPHNLQLPLTPLPLQLLPTFQQVPLNNNIEDSHYTEQHHTLDKANVSSIANVNNRKIEITNTNIEKYPSSDSVHPSMLCGGRTKKSHNTNSNMETKGNSSSGNHTNPITRSLRFRRKSGNLSSGNNGKQRHRGNNPVAPLGNDTSPIVNKGHSTTNQKASSDIGIGSRMHSMSLLDDSYLDDTSTVSQQPGTTLLASQQHSHDVSSNIASSSSSIVTKRTVKDKTLKTANIAPNSSVAMQKHCHGEFSIDNNRHQYELIMEGGNNRGIPGTSLSRSSTLVRNKKKAGATLSSSAVATAAAANEVYTTPPIIKCRIKKNQFNLKPKVTTCTTSFLNLVNIANAARVATNSITPSSPTQEQQQVFCDSYNPLYSTSSSSHKHLPEINSTTVLEDDYDEEDDTINYDDDNNDAETPVNLLSQPQTTPDNIAIIAHGLLSRKTYRRHFSSSIASPFLSLWQRYWVTLMHTIGEPKSAFLVYFELSSSLSSSALSNLTASMVSRCTLASLIKSSKCYVQDLQQVVIGRHFSHNSVIKLNKTAPPQYRPKPAATADSIPSTSVTKEHFYLQDCQYSVVYKFKSPATNKKPSSSGTILSSSPSSSSICDQIPTNPSINAWISVLIRTLNSVQQLPKSDELDLINLNDS